MKIPVLSVCLQVWGKRCIFARHEVWPDSVAPCFRRGGPHQASDRLAKLTRDFLELGLWPAYEEISLRLWHLAYYQDPLTYPTRCLALAIWEWLTILDIFRLGGLFFGEAFWTFSGEGPWLLLSGVDDLVDRKLRKLPVFRKFDQSHFKSTSLYFLCWPLDILCPRSADYSDHRPVCAVGCLAETISNYGGFFGSRKKRDVVSVKWGDIAAPVWIASGFASAAQRIIAWKRSWVWIVNSFFPWLKDDSVWFSLCVFLLPEFMATQHSVYISWLDSTYTKTIGIKFHTIQLIIHL